MNLLQINTSPVKSQLTTLESIVWCRISFINLKCTLNKEVLQFQTYLCTSTSFTIGNSEGCTYFKEYKGSIYLWTWVTKQKDNPSIGSYSIHCNVNNKYKIRRMFINLTKLIAFTYYLRSIRREGIRWTLLIRVTLSGVRAGLVTLASHGHAQVLVTCTMSMTHIQRATLLTVSLIGVHQHYIDRYRLLAGTHYSKCFAYFISLW